MATLERALLLDFESCVFSTSTEKEAILSDKPLVIMKPDEIDELGSITVNISPLFDSCKRSLTDSSKPIFFVFSVNSPVPSSTDSVMTGGYLLGTITSRMEGINLRGSRMKIIKVIGIGINTTRALIVGIIGTKAIVISGIEKNAPREIISVSGLRVNLLEIETSILRVIRKVGFMEVTVNLVHMLMIMESKQGIID